MIALDLAITTIRARGDAPAASAPLIASINVEGWSAEYAVPGDLPAITLTLPSEMAPDTAPKTVAVSRAGFDASGAAVSHSDTRIITKRKRQAYPNHALATAQTVALDDYVYATDTIAGVVNNSSETSPKPVAAFVTPSRLLIGNTIGAGTGAPVEVIAFHRDFRLNRQVACVVYTITDGVKTITVAVGATVISTSVEDANPVEVYALPATDISALATGTIRVDAKVCPWIGDASSILDSATNATPREFSTRYYHKDAALAAAPPLAYVKAGGSDATGVWSTNAATALATPFATVLGAFAAIKHATRGTPDKTGTGARVRIVDNTVNNGAGTTVTFPQGAAGPVIERAPGTARGEAVFNFGSSYFRPQMTCSIAGLEPHITFCDLSIARTVNTQKIFAETGVPIGAQFWNVAINDTAGASPWQNAHGYFFGAAFATTNLWLSLNTGLQIRMTRGVVGDLNNGAYEQWVLVGCTLQQPGSQGYTDATRGAISYANRLLKMKAIAPGFAIDAANPGDRITGIAIVQNLFEVAGGHANGSPALRLSSDNANGDTVHTVIAHNTLTGFYGTGRNNNFYDESTGTNRRQHRLIRAVGNIHCAINTKGDIFYGGSNPAEAPNRIGQLAYVHGVGCQGEFSQFCAADGAATGSGFSQLYPGIGASIGTSATVRSDPLFMDYQAMTGPTAYGVGGGDYRLKPGSPARGRVMARGLAFDLAGAARPTSGADAAGAYS
ncbi:hypothetical protein [uncultured Sphingomonas sp.]|uniref:hypothetical protein n=1 Tax=uncultured Sphingomonas sp. TaxID=158754 RepID=UPI00262163C1|nr:hypothetical protein [uncultured Sphingomonas sp.]